MPLTTVLQPLPSSCGALIECLQLLRTYPRTYQQAAACPGSRGRSRAARPARPRPPHPAAVPHRPPRPPAHSPRRPKPAARRGRAPANDTAAAGAWRCDAGPRPHPHVAAARCAVAHAASKGGSDDAGGDDGEDAAAAGRARLGAAGAAAGGGGVGERCGVAAAACGVHDGCAAIAVHAAVAAWRAPCWCECDASL